MEYELFYDLVVQEAARLRARDIANDDQVCKALAACYELQSYLANRIAEQAEFGEMDDE